MKDSQVNESFSIEDSEELITRLKEGDSFPAGPLHAALQTLSHVDDLPKSAVPPVLPSGIKELIYKMPIEFSKTRTAVVSLIATALVASATLTAAAVTNTGPAPLVRVAHETAKFVKEVAGVVTKAVTGSSATQGSTPTPTPTQTESSTPTPTPTQTQSSTPTPTHSATTPVAAAVVPAKSPKPEHSEKSSPTPTHSEEAETPTPTPTPSTGISGLTPPVVSGGGGDDEHEGSSNGTGTGEHHDKRSPSPTKQPESNSGEDD